MSRYLVEIQIEESEVTATLDELEQAIEKVKACYLKLKEMGVLTVHEDKNATCGN